MLGVAQRICGGEADRFAYRALGLFGVAAALLREAADQRGGVVPCFTDIASAGGVASLPLASPLTGAALRSPPGRLIVIGVAAPSIVAGAIAATWAAYRM